MTVDPAVLFRFLPVLFRQKISIESLAALNSATCRRKNGWRRFAAATLADVKQELCQDLSMLMIC